MTPSIWLQKGVASLNSDASANGRPRPVLDICRLTWPLGNTAVSGDRHSKHEIHVTRTGILKVKTQCGEVIPKRQMCLSNANNTGF